MKRFFYAVLVTLVMVGMSSCSSKMDLKGTTWVGTHSMNLGELVGEEGEEVPELVLTTTLIFSSETEGTMRFEAFGESEDQSFTYTCDNKGNGVIKGTDEDDGSPMESNFTIDGDKLTITEDGTSFEFTKQ